MITKIRTYSNRTTKIIDGKKFKWYGWERWDGEFRPSTYHPVGLIAEHSNEPHRYSGTVTFATGYHLWIPVKMRS